MPLTTSSAALIRALIYPVQFETDPRDGAERVLDQVVAEQCLDATPAEYRQAVREALESDDALAELLPQDHSEEAIRDYLRDLDGRLERRWGATAR